MLHNTYSIPAGIANLEVGAQSLKKLVEGKFQGVTVDVKCFKATKVKNLKRSYIDVMVLGRNKANRPLRLAVKVKAGGQTDLTPWKQIKKDIANEVEEEYNS